MFKNNNKSSRTTSMTLWLTLNIFLIINVIVSLDDVIVNFEHIPHLFYIVSIVGFEQVKVSWVRKTEN